MGRGDHKEAEKVYKGAKESEKKMTDKIICEAWMTGYGKMTELKPWLPWGSKEPIPFPNGEEEEEE